VWQGKRLTDFCFSILEISNDDISGIVISLYVTDHLASLTGTPRLALPYMDCCDVLETLTPACGREQREFS